MNKIQDQIAKVWHLLFSQETGETYRNAIFLTGEIIKETIKLVWLFACLGFLFLTWGWMYSVIAGRNLRTWYNSIEDRSTDRVLGEAGRVLLLAGSTGATLAVTQAKSQLGIENDPKPIEAIASEASPTESASSPVNTTVLETEDNDSSMV